MYEYSARLIRVIDGDTYELDIDLGLHCHRIEKCRLQGADTPEVYGKNACDAGREASEFVKKLLAQQDPVLHVCTYKDRAGKYGRYLVDVKLQADIDGDPIDQWLSDYLVGEGQAVPYPG